MKRLILILILLVFMGCAAKQLTSEEIKILGKWDIVGTFLKDEYKTDFQGTIEFLPDNSVEWHMRKGRFTFKESVLIMEFYNSAMVSQLSFVNNDEIKMYIAGIFLDKISLKNKGFIDNKDELKHALHLKRKI